MLKKMRTSWVDSHEIANSSSVNVYWMDRAVKIRIFSYCCFSYWFSYSSWNRVENNDAISSWIRWRASKEALGRRGSLSSLEKFISAKLLVCVCVWIRVYLEKRQSGMFCAEKKNVCAVEKSEHSALMASLWWMNRGTDGWCFYLI